MGGASPEQILSKVTPPAIGLIVTGVLNALIAVWNVISSIMFMAGVGPAIAAQPQQIEQLNDSGLNGEQFMAVLNIFQGPVGMAIGVLEMVAAALIVLGGIKMKNLRSYNLALTASIVAMIPYLSGCCCVGLPIGIWAIVILMDPNVKQSFR
jgi:hypothetical protein